MSRLVSSQMVLVVVIGALFFRYGTEAQEPPSFMDCIYFAVVMVTTVGFGAKRRQFCADFDWNRDQFTKTGSG